MGFFHLAICIWGSSTSSVNLLAHFFLSLNNTTLSGCTTVCLSVHLLKVSLVASTFWQWWVVLLSPFDGRFSASTFVTWDVELKCRVVFFYRIFVIASACGQGALLPWSLVAAFPCRSPRLALAQSWFVSAWQSYYWHLPSGKLTRLRWSLELSDLAGFRSLFSFVDGEWHLFDPSCVFCEPRKVLQEAICSLKFTNSCRNPWKCVHWDI